MRILESAVITAALFLFAACGGGAGSVLIPAPSSRIVLNANSPRPTIEVVDVPLEQLRAIEGTASREAWAAILKVSAGAGRDQPAADGQYAIEDGRIRFTPMFPLDPGRQYHVTFAPPGGEAVTATVGLPPADTTPKTMVSRVFPSADVVPENQLRLYLHFSAPMGMRGGLDFIHLLDESGKEVKDSFLPLDAEFWNDDRTSYTVFFDPSRRHRDSAAIAGKGPALIAGKSYTLVVDAGWRDGHGLPLKHEFRRTLTAGPPDERPLDTKTWKLAAPPVGSVAALTIAFPEPLDHGLLLGALSVAAPGGKPLEGAVTIGDDELTWSFTPVEPWKAGAYNVVAVAPLEDLAGNGIGRVFDAEQFDRTDSSSEPAKTLIAFVVRP